MPVTGVNIEKAIELNGVAVKSNLEAFRLGRRIAVDQDLLAQLEAPGTQRTAPPILEGAAKTMAGAIDTDDELAEVLAWRIPELISYQSQSYAKQFCDDIARVRKAEVAVSHGEQVPSELTQTVARQLFKLMAYKDEYEVARLALKSDVADQARARFGPNAKVSYRLRPPTLQAVGYTKKISVPSAAGAKMFKGLLKTKRLRGTRFDPFGQSEERKTERALIDSYRTTIDTIVLLLTEDNYDQAITLANVADQIRGYDTVKMANVEQYRSDLAEALKEFSRQT